MRSLAVPALLCAGLAVASGQTGSLRGRVTMDPSGEPITGANVVVQGTTRGTTTDADGRFHLDRLPSGRHILSVSLVGFLRVDRAVAVGDSSGDITVALVQLPVQGEPVIVTANRREQAAREVPVSVSTMDASTIAFRNSVTVDDALRYVSGVNLTEYQVNIRGSSGYSRGVGSRVLLLVDGIPFLTGDTGELNFETLPVGQVDRIEVVKGAASALYGSSALGGVINVITRPPAGEPATTIRAFGGLFAEPSYRQWEWRGGTRFFDGEAVSHSFTTGDLGLLFHVARVADDGYRQNDSRRRLNGYLKARYEFSPYDDMSLTANVMHQERGSFLYWKDLSHALVPPDAQQGDQVRSTRLFLSSQYRKIVSGTILLVARAMWFRNNWFDSIDTLTNTSRSDVVRAEVQSTITFSDAHVLTVGLEGSADGVDADLFGSRKGFGVALYAQDELRAGSDLTLTLGVRFDAQDLDSLDATSQVNPKAGLVYMPVQGTTLRASVGTGFRAPSVAEAFIVTQAGGIDIIPNPTLKPERSVSYEIGISQLLGSAFLFDVALFQSDFRDLIEPRFVAVGGALKGQFNNVTRARVRGLEASLRAALFGGALLPELGYTYVNPRDLTANDVLKYRPRHLFYATLIGTAGWFRGGVDFRAISRVEKIDEEFSLFVNDAETRVPIYVLDVRAGGDFSTLGTPLSVTLGVTNILQYNYVELVGNLSPPRAYTLTVEARL